MTNEPEWVERLEKKIEENYFVTPSSHLNVDGLKLFIKEEKEKSYREGLKENIKNSQRDDKKWATLLYCIREDGIADAKAELLSKIEEEVENIDVVDNPNGELVLDELRLKLSKYKTL